MAGEPQRRVLRQAQDNSLNFLRGKALSKLRRKTERVEGVKRGNLYVKKG